MHCMVKPILFYNVSIYFASTEPWREKWTGDKNQKNQQVYIGGA